MSGLERDQLALHVAFLGVAAVALLAPAGPPLGWRLVLLVGLYHVVTATVARPARHRTWLRLWWFAILLGAMLGVSVAVLEAGLGTLRVEATGPLHLGALPGSVLLVWAVPLTGAVALADAAGRRLGERASWTAALLLGGLLLTGTDVALVHLGVWTPVDVVAVGGVALYLVPAWCFLGVAALAGARWTRDGPPRRAPGVAAVVALAHTGAVAVAWLVVERGLAG